MTVPGMLWNGTEQSYAKEPSVPNVCRKDWPFSRGPESNSPGVFEVTVCVVASWFVQHTVVPGGTVTDAGEKAKPLIETSVSPASQGPGAAVPPTATARPTHAAQQVDRKAIAFIDP